MSLPDPPSPAAVTGRRPQDRPALRRAGWSLANQGVSSATNIGIAIVAARALDPRSFGAFGLALAVYTLIVGISRSLVTDPLLVRYSARSTTDNTVAAGRAAGSAVAFGLLAATVVAGSALVLGGEAGEALRALAVVLPGLLLQDAWRHCFFAAARPAKAVANEVGWAGFQVVAVVVLAAGGHLTLTWLVLAWGLSGTMAGLFGCLQTRSRPVLGAAWTWVAEHRDLGARYLLDFLSAAGASQVALFGLGVVAGLPALGAVRAGQIFFGPINVVFTGILLVLVPEGVRLSQVSEYRLLRLAAVSSVVLTLGALAMTGIGILLPESVGESLFGVTWPATATIIPLLGASVAGGGAAAGAYAGLRSLGTAKASLRARLVMLPVAIVAPLVGAVVGDAVGFCAGLTVAAWVAAGIWWRYFNRELAGLGQRRGAPGARTDGEPTAPG